MAADRFFCNLVKAHAFDAGRSAGEECLDEIRPQADRVENLRAAIGLIRGDAHLGHHLVEPLVDRLDVALDDLLVLELLRQLILHGDERFEGEIRIDRLRPIAGKTTEVMHFARLAGLDDQADRGAKALADQVMVNGGAGQQRWNRNAVGAGIAIRQNDDVDAVPNRLFGLVAQVGKRGGKSSRPMIETRLMTISSRIGSIGGFVTCAKFCLKYVNSSFGRSDSAEIGVSLPMEPTASSPVAPIGDIRILRSSWLYPKACCRSKSVRLESGGRFWARGRSSRTSWVLRSHSS